MSMLEVITKAASANNDSNSEYPIVLNPDPILLNLKSNHPHSFLKPVHGWKISQTDSDIIKLTRNFYNNLKINSKSFTNKQFLTLFNSYLEKNAEKSGIFIPLQPKHDPAYTYTNLLLQKAGFLMPDAVLALVMEACFGFELWEVFQSLIVGGFVNASCCKDFVSHLIEKKRPDLLCLCLNYVSDLGVNHVLLVLKFFLSPTKDAYATMVLVRKEWESLTVLAIEMAMDKTLSEKKLNLAKDAALLLTMAYDDFTTSELCLHYLLASPNVDDVIFSACIAKLNGAEIMGLIRYLNKWLGKYHKFPQACSTPKASSAHGLKAFELVPSLEQVTKCFGLVIDEHFSSLVMLPEFREEVKSIELVVNSLASEARLCCTLANLTASLKN